MGFSLRPAAAAGSGALAVLNRQLVEDEGSRNPMSLAELESRMRRWLEEGWSALLISCGERLAGYCLYQIGRDAYQPDLPLVYVRHYCIARDVRGQGLGRGAFERITKVWFPPGARLTLDVLESNPSGRAFWEALGFVPYCTTFERIPRDS